ncbi:conserved hypothetical protein [Talaromyces stipitatus ATCC 10500]|uniref:Ribosome biogenesis protein SLX9 n=1 Tax=Talaromyces stipitatus (strain ATCC 10500 / CBS 375.48 / QM 6759 / NRRL 1006) TaxID=441959 RepID=B8MB46_TALSN|nr:uncharacterized protein TSTA_124660 [Talaromyces stipitatus ATCC 10500]EED18747.1 conserved hypothetical protein [Talaromyces stipitatus ATCC 10500]
MQFGSPYLYVSRCAFFIISNLIIDMAPVAPTRKAPSGRGAIPSVNHGLFPDEFRTTKKDKRLIKHSVFVNKVAKSQLKSPKRRRPSKKLVTSLDSLADALPDADDEVTSDIANQANIIRHKTLKHRPGAMKRKEKMEKLERNRFIQNMAQMSAIEQAASNAQQQPENQFTSTGSNSTSNRWAALRGFISQTMEHQPAFKNGK